MQVQDAEDDHLARSLASSVILALSRRGGIGPHAAEEIGAYQGRRAAMDKFPVPCGGSPASPIAAPRIMPTAVPAFSAALVPGPTMRAHTPASPVRGSRPCLLMAHLFVSS